MHTKPTLSALLTAAAMVSLALTHTRAAENDTRRNRFAPYPEVQPISQGISWPKGQALPRFATPAEPLDAIEVQALTRDEQITFSALQGQVNKTRPRILLLDARSDEGRDTWSNTETVNFPKREIYSRRNRYDLVTKYSTDVEGLLLYDTRRSPHYRNLAGTVASLNRLLPVTAEVLERIEAQGLDLEVKIDLTELAYTTPIEIYEHLYETYWDQCEQRVIVSVRPDDRGGDHHHTRDLAAACGGAVVWLDCRIPEERDVMRKFFGDMQAGNAIALGWYTSERSGITTASEFGIGTLPADHFISSTVFAGGDPKIQIPPVPKMPELENKVYLAIFISDGDNIQYSQRAMRRIWDASAKHRGQVPLNWTIAPGLVDIAPGILNYYYGTATPQDCFVTGPSGMGYAMPFNTLNEPGAPVGEYLKDGERMDGYARLTETYLQRSGLRVATIWDDATPMQRGSYERHCRNLYGATVQNFRDVPEVKGGVENDRLRFEKLVIPYTGTDEHFRRSLRRQLRTWDGESPRFLSYQVDIWGEMKPEKIVALVRDFNQRYPGKLEFVRADHYFNLSNQAQRLPYNLCLSEQTKVTSARLEENADLVIDGTPVTCWESASSENQWLQFDFGQAYQISRYVIRHAGQAGYDRKQNTKAYTIEASLDGESWQPLDQFRGNRLEVTDVEIKPTKARYLKLTIDDPGEDGTARIADVEIYGAGEG